jgi:hypothetical protein
MKKALTIAVVLLASSMAFSQLWSGVIDPARAVDWTNAGISGGVPSSGWSNCTTAACNLLYCNVNSSGAGICTSSVSSTNVSVTNINAALTSATASTVVRVPSGTFTLTGNIFTNRSSVVLRGAGPTATTFVLNGFNILGGSGSGGQGSAPGSLATTSLSTLTRGSTVLTVGSTTSLSAGQVIQIDQLNAAYVNPTGNEGTENPGRCPSPLSFQGCDGTRAQYELVQIHSVDTSTQITIEAPGLSHTYTSGLTPQVFYWSSSGVGKSVGFENFKVDAGDGTAGHAASDFAVALSWCNFCWIKNVAVINGHRAALYSLWSYRAEIRDNYVSESNTAGAPTEYGIECDGCTFGLIENNILFGVTTPLIFETAYGMVAGYNYMLNSSAGDEFPNLDLHRSHDFLQLYEGNVVGTIAMDNIWGSGSHNTAFRNRASGKDPNKTNYRLPMAISANNRYVNIIGNVLGDSSFHNAYQCTNTIAIGTNTFIYELGFDNRCELGNTGYDANVKTTLMRWGNYDTVTAAVRWCGNSSSTGWGTTCSSTSEVPTGDANFPNAVPASESIPASFYKSAKPSWFGSVAWPPIGPDVTCAANCISNAGSHANKIPAQLCYDSTAKDASGFLTAFDASVCYAAATTYPRILGGGHTHGGGHVIH